MITLPPAIEVAAEVGGYLTIPPHLLRLDWFSLKLIREGRKDGERGGKEAVYLPFDAWLGVVHQMLPDAQRAKFDASGTFWRGRWEANLSPVEALMSAAVSHPPALTQVSSTPRDGDHPV
jgi:hypothetical protein